MPRAARRLALAVRIARAVRAEHKYVVACRSPVAARAAARLRGGVVEAERTADRIAAVLRQAPVDQLVAERIELRTGRVCSRCISGEDHAFDTLLQVDIEGGNAESATSLEPLFRL